jgi:hypothetical protein
MTHDPSEKPQQYWILNEQIKFGETVSSNPKDHACLVALFRIPIESNSVHLLEYSAFEKATARIKRLEEALEKEECDCSSSTGELQTKGPDTICNRCEALKESP